jgi:hypothetical protein
VLKGAYLQTPAPVRKLPISYKILVKLLKKINHRFDTLVLSAAITLAFFGCLRMGDLRVLDSMVFLSDQHLCLGDVNLNETEKTLDSFLRRSKIDVSNVGVHVYLGCSGAKGCCAYCSMRDYLEFCSKPQFESDDRSQIASMREYMVFHIYCSS